MESIPGALDHIVVIPTTETADEILNYMGGCPFDYQPSETWHVSVYIGESSLINVDLHPEIIYKARGVKADLWYDEETRMTNLVIALESADLNRRYNEIRSTSGIESPYKDHYVPHMTLVYGFPELSAAYKNFKNSLSMSVHRLGEVFQFNGEMLINSGGHTPNMLGTKYFDDRHN